MVVAKVIIQFTAVFIFIASLSNCSSSLRFKNQNPKNFVQGDVATGFEAVKSEFVKNFTHRGEIGSAFCVYYEGKKVVDLWGGYSSLKTKEPWNEDTIVRVYSTTKGMALLVLAKLQSDGLLDYHENVSNYWPEFGKNDKENITVEQLITHKSGLVLLDRNVFVSELHDFDTLSELLVNAVPLWTPGEKHGYHSATIGLYMQQLVQRIDKKGRTIGEYFSDEIAVPLGVEFFIGLPDNFDKNRLATLKMVSPPLALLNLNKSPKELRKKIRSPKSLFWKSMLLIKNDTNNQLVELSFEEASGGGAGDARALAKVYGNLAIGGEGLNISPETLEIMIKYTDPPINGTKDEVMGWESLGSSAGYTKPYEAFDFSNDSAFGFSGTGGSLAFADPLNKIGYAYVMNKMGYYNINDPREVALREALYKCIDRMNNN